MTPGAHLLTVLIFFPALGALALMILRADDHAWIRRMALVVATFEFLLSLLLIPGVPLGSAGYKLELNIPWITNPPIHYQVGVIGVFFSLDLFLFFLFWEIMLIPMAFLIGIWGHERRIYAAVKFVLYTMAGSILMLVGILWLYNASGAVIEGGTFDLPAIQAMLQHGDISLAPRTEMLLFLAFFVAF